MNNVYRQVSSPRHSRLNLWLALALAVLLLVLVLASGGLVWTLATQGKNEGAGTPTPVHAQSSDPAAEAPATSIGGTIHPQVEPQAGEPAAVWSTTLVTSVPPGQSQNGYDIDAVYEHPNGTRYNVGVKNEDDGSGQALLDSLEDRHKLGRLECGVDATGSGCVGTVEGIGLIVVHSTSIASIESSRWCDAFVAEMLKGTKNKD